MRQTTPGEYGAQTKAKTGTSDNNRLAKGEAQPRKVKSKGDGIPNDSGTDAPKPLTRMGKKPTQPITKNSQ